MSFDIAARGCATYIALGFSDPLRRHALKTTATLDPSFHASHSMNALYRPAQKSSASETVADDWELLFDAITARLRLIAGDLLAGPDALPPENAAMRFQADVLECATALDQLHLVIKDQIVARSRRPPRRRRGESL